MKTRMTPIMAMVHAEMLRGMFRFSQIQEGATAAMGTTSTFTATGGFPNGTYVGKVVEFTSGNVDGEKRKITNYVDGTKTFTVDPPFAVNPSSGAEFKVFLTPKQRRIPFMVSKYIDNDDRIGPLMIWGHLDTGNITRTSNADRPECDESVVQMTNWSLRFVGPGIKWEILAKKFQTMMFSTKKVIMTQNRSIQTSTTSNRDFGLTLLMCPHG